MLNHLSQQLDQLVPQQRHFLIGLSGGVDSVVLLHLFCQLQQTKSLNLRAIHIHHGLSPNADDWAAFCQQLCEQWQIPFHLKKVDVVGKQGIEANARLARYQAIQTWIQSDEILVTAHHLDDQVETFFLALKRGAGIKGLSAMQAVSFWQKLTIFRPLLTQSKANILCYAQSQKLHWVEDESNQNNDFERNFIRNQILPVLNQRWQHFNHMVQRASQDCTAQQQLIEELLAEDLAKRLDETTQCLDISDFSLYSKVRQQQLLRLWLAKCRMPMPSRAQLDQLIQQLILAKQDRNPQFKFAEKVIRRYQQSLFITVAESKQIPFEIALPTPYVPIPFRIKIEQKTGAIQIRRIAILIKSPHLFSTKYAQLEIILPENIGTITRTTHTISCKKSHKTNRLQLPPTLQYQTLKITLTHSGKIKCYGKAHNEEMKKIWQYYQIPIWERHRTPLIFFGEELIGVI